jgi:hypothetical protein
MESKLLVEFVGGVLGKLDEVDGIDEPVSGII